VKRYGFNLETVMRVRKVQESTAKAHLQRANVAATVAAASALQSMAHYDEIRGAKNPSWMGHREQSELAARATIEARQSLTGAETSAKAALDQYVASAQAVSVLEHLDDRRREEYAEAAQREESTFVDELVTNRHIRRQEQLVRNGKR